MSGWTAIAIGATVGTTGTAALALSAATWSWSLLSSVLPPDLGLESASEVLSEDDAAFEDFVSDLVSVLVLAGLVASVWSEGAALSFADPAPLRSSLRELEWLGAGLLERCGCVVADDCEGEGSDGVAASSSAAKLSPSWDASGRLDFGAGVGTDGLTGMFDVTLATWNPSKRLNPRQFSKERAMPGAKRI